MYEEIYSMENLILSYKKAKKGKSKKNYVIQFEKNLNNNLIKLSKDLESLRYSPKPLKTFILRDPKTRKISKNAFEDRIIHHALINIIEPTFDKSFIYDSYANRKNKGNSFAIKRLTSFQRKITKNNKIKAYFLKADIKHYFQEVNHNILIEILKKKIKDENIIWLITKIINNIHKEENIKKGMPLGNLTSQFFANLYLNELDQFVKHKLKAKYYGRYVDDFIILHNSKEQLGVWKEEINNFLKTNLRIELHPEKSEIMHIKKGISFLGFRNFHHHKILKKNKRKLLKNKLNLIIKEHKEINNYKKLMNRIEAIFAHLETGNTFHLRNKIVNKVTNIT